MGYTTTFEGCFKFNKQLTLRLKNELDAIHDKDWRNDTSRPGGDKDELSYHCQWVSDKQGMYLEWDQGENFYFYIEWLQWLINNFFYPIGIKLNGEVNWQGEENSDLGKIIVKDNELKIKKGKVVWELEKVKKYKI